MWLLEETRKLFSACAHYPGGVEVYIWVTDQQFDLLRSSSARSLIRSFLLSVPPRWEDTDTDKDISWAVNSVFRLQTLQTCKNSPWSSLAL
eukprot:1560442-Amphidinium_carterae.1